MTGLGADIRLVCETCGRKILLPRPSLDRRVKAFVDRGPVPIPEPSAVRSSVEAPVEVTYDMLGLKVDDILEATSDLDVRISFYYLTIADSGSGHLSAGQRVRVTTMPRSRSDKLLLEPLEYDVFEQRFVPGGVRQHQTYAGYAISMGCSDIARCFRPLSNETGDLRPVQGDD